MLSRVANSLYWMSRYIERAENIARILDVNQQLLLDHWNSGSVRPNEQWKLIAQSLGDLDAFLVQGDTEHAAALEFMVFQQSNPNSILSSIFLARENARMVRDQITVETWEVLNRLYLTAFAPKAHQRWLDNPSDFFAQVKGSSLQLIGLGAATHLHNEGWWFSLVGQFIERADKTSRILDLFHETLPPRGIPKTVSQVEALQWSAVLRSCSALDAYRSLYGARIHPREVADLLLLNQDFPRSVRFCVEQLNQSLRRISGVAEHRFLNDPEKLAGRLVADLQFCTIEEIFNLGLHDYLDILQEKLNAIGEALFQTYIFHSFAIGTGEQFVQQEQQQQQAHDLVFSSR